MSSLETLRREVEDLAMRLVVSQPGPEGATEGSPCAASAAGWIASLARIGESARREGAGQAETIVSGAIQALSHDPGAHAPLEPVQSAILALQQALNGAENAPADAAPNLAQDRELMADFILESREHLSTIEAQALKLEGDGCDREALNAVFRAFHTVKGLAGFLEQWEIQRLAHEVEAVLDRARNAELTLTPAAIDVILESADHLGRWLTHLEAGLENRPSAPPAGDQPLYERITGLLAEAQGSIPSPADPQAAAASAGAIQPHPPGVVPPSAEPAPAGPAPAPAG